MFKITETQTTSTKATESIEDLALDLHRKVREANPGKDVEVTVGAKHCEGVTIATKSEVGPFIAGAVVGLALSGLATLIGVFW